MGAEGCPRRGRLEGQIGRQGRMESDRMKKQALAKAISISLALGLAAAAQGAIAQAPASGFYGGVTIRDHGAETQGLSFGPAPAYATRFATSVADDVAAARASTLFGGYRWSNDVAVEASLASIDKYAIAPSDASPRGVGLNLARGAGSLGDLSSRSWNVDVVTTWSFLRSFSLYGRLGYAQSDSSPAGLAALAATDPRRLGVNYGVGLRYDVTSSLGLKVEYSRFGRFAGEMSSILPDSDQVSVGLQLRF
jgi:opacity protein-like surface antigen